MGNRIGSQRADLAGGAASQFNTRRRYQQHKREYCLQDEYRSKTLPARHQQPEPSSDNDAEPQRQPRLETSSCLGSGNGATGGNHNNSGETTPRMLFLLYLIHRTWNVVMDTVDTRTKR